MSESNRYRIHAATRRILKPLVRLLLRQGIAAGELADLCKAIYVETAAAEHLRPSGRVNQSRVAIVTGLTRAEVRRLLISPRSDAARYEWHKHRASRVLLGWYQDPDFLDRRGLPRILPVRGRQNSFAKLVRRYSGDMPVRAMLDELIASGAIATNKNGQVRVKLKTVPTGDIDAKSVATIGNKLSDYLSTLVRNSAANKKPLFEATAFSANVDKARLPILNRDIRIQGGSFIASIGNQLQLVSSGKRQKKNARTPRAVRLGVTVFVFEVEST